MLPTIQENVGQRVPHLAWRPKRMRMIPVRPNAPVTLGEAIDCLCESNPESLHAASERALVRRFDQKMDVVRLDGKLNDAEGAIGPDRDRLAKRGEDALAAELWQAAYRA